MPSRSILFITREIIPFYYGGIGTLFQSLAMLLLAQGHKVSFLTEKSEGFSQEEFDKHYNKIPVFFVKAPSQDSFVDYSPTGGVVSTHQLAYSFAVAQAYEEIEKSVGLDVVLSADYGGEAYVLLTKKALGRFSETRFILHLSGGLHEILEAYQGQVPVGSFNELDEPKNKIVCAMEDSCLRLADTIISPSQSAWNQVKERLNLVAKEADIIPNLPAPDLKNTGVHSPERQSQDKMILFVGRLDRLKGADILLELCIEFLEQTAEDISVVFVGRDCFYKEYGHTFLEEWNKEIPSAIAPQIHFTGQVNHQQVMTYMCDASVCIFPSRFEVFGLVCLEAMSHGVPTMVSANTGLAELMGSDLTDYVFDFHQDKDRFFRSLRSLLFDSEKQQLVGEEVRKRAQSIIAEGERGYKQLFEKDGKIDGETLTDKIIFDSLLEVLNEVSLITHYLSNDLTKLTNFYHVDEDQFKSIVQQGKIRHNRVLTALRSLFNQ